MLCGEYDTQFVLQNYGVQAFGKPYSRIEGLFKIAPKVLASRAIDFENITQSCQLGLILIILIILLGDLILILASNNTFFQSFIVIFIFCFR